MTANEIIEQLEKFQTRLYLKGQDGIVVPAPPGDLADTLLLIRGLLIQLTDKVAEAEKDYRHTKAARYDEFIKSGIKKSPAVDALEFEKDLIDKKVGTERLRNYMKYVDGLCTSIQSVLRVQTGSNKGEY